MSNDNFDHPREPDLNLWGEPTVPPQFGSAQGDPAAAPGYPGPSGGAGPSGPSQGVPPYQPGTPPYGQQEFGQQQPPTFGQPQPPTFGQQEFGQQAPGQPPPGQQGFPPPPPTFGEQQPPPTFGQQPGVPGDQPPGQPWMPASAQPPRFGDDQSQEVTGSGPVAQAPTPDPGAWPQSPPTEPPHDPYVSENPAPGQENPAPEAPQQGMPGQGMPGQGMPGQGMPGQGIPSQEVPAQQAPEHQSAVHHAADQAPTGPYPGMPPAPQMGGGQAFPPAPGGPSGPPGSQPGGYPPAGPQGGIPQAPQPYGQAPAAPFGGGYGYQPSQPGYPAQPPKSNTKRTVALIAIPLAVVLVVVGIFLATRGGGDNPVGVASPSGSGASGASASGSAQGGPAPTAKAPGPGTTTSALDYLKKNGFTCSDEGNKAIVSMYCTHFTKSPGMAAYVGGRADGSLGRLSIDIQTDTPSSATEAMTAWALKQFVGDEANETKIAEAIKKGNDDKWAEGAVGEVHYRGADDGSVVLFVEGWYPTDLKPVAIQTSVANLSQYVISKGYTCKASTVDAQKCTRSGNGNVYTVYMRQDSTGSQIRAAYVSVDREEPTPNLPAVVKSEVTMFLNGMGDQASPWKTYIYDANGVGGDTGFVGGMLLDWYPGGASSATSGGLSLQTSCWEDYIKRC